MGMKWRLDLNLNWGLVSGGRVKDMILSRV